MFAVQKRDQQVVDWVTDCEGIVELVHGAPSILQVYLDRQAAAEGSTSRAKASSTMDKRTFMLSIDRLVDKGQLKVKRVALQNGNEMVTTKVAYLADLEQAKVNQFMAHLTHGPRPARPGPVPGESVKQEVVELEATEMDLDEDNSRRPRRTEQVNRTLSLQDLLAVDGDPEAIHQLFASDSRVVSQQYGYMTGVCARAALFHRELLQMLESHSASDPDEVLVSAEKRVFSMVDTIGALSLDVYLKLVSLKSSDSELGRLLETPDGRQMKMHEMPRALRSILTVDRAGTFEKFQKLIQLMYYLKLAIPYARASPDKPHDLEIEIPGETDPLLYRKDLSVSFTHFRLLAQSAPLYAIGNRDSHPPLVDVVPVETSDDVDEFWERMEDCALNETEVPSGPFSPSFSVFPQTCEYPNLRVVARSTSWTKTYALGPIQREFLAHQVDHGLAAAGPTQEDIDRLSYMTGAPSSAVELFVGHLIRKRQRTREAAQKRLQEAERIERARTEKATREKLAAKRAEQRIQLEEDWSALARKYLVTNRIEITDQLATNLRGLRDVELADTTRSHLDAIHIAEVVQEMLDTEPRMRAQPKPPAPPAPAAGPAPRGRPPQLSGREKQLMATQRRASRASGRGSVADSAEDEDEHQAPPGGDGEEEPPRARVIVPCKLVSAEDDELIAEAVKHMVRSDPTEPGRRRARQQYTDELDDLILDLGAILLGRATRPGVRMFWKPVEKVIPSAPHGTIRVRFLKLREDPLRAAYIDRLKDAYIDLWRTHRKTDALPDPPKYRSDQFDIVHHLKFFRKNINKDSMYVRISVSSE